MEQLSGLIVGIASFAIVAVVVFLIMSNLAANSQVSADDNATQAVADMQNAADDIPDWVPLIIVAIVGALLLGITALFSRRR